MLFWTERNGLKKDRIDSLNNPIPKEVFLLKSIWIEVKLIWHLVLSLLITSKKSVNINSKPLLMLNIEFWTIKKTEEFRAFHHTDETDEDASLSIQALLSHIMAASTEEAIGSA